MKSNKIPKGKIKISFSISTFFFAALLLIGFISCNYIPDGNPFDGNGPSTIVNGYVKNFYTGEPIKDAKVVIYYSPCNDCYSYQILDSTTTDDDGAYGLKFYGSKKETYYLDTWKDGYYLPGSWQTIYFTDLLKIEDTWVTISKEEINEIDFLFKLKADIKILVTTQQPFTDMGDEIRITYPFYDTTRPFSRNYFGPNSISFISICPGGIDHTISWEVTRNNNTQYFSGSVYCAPFQETEFIINY